MVLFGLFHGLCFLPVLLSLLGPEPYLQADTIPPPAELIVPGKHSKAKKYSESEESEIAVVQNGSLYDIPVMSYS